MDDRRKPRAKAADFAWPDELVTAVRVNRRDRRLAKKTVLKGLGSTKALPKGSLKKRLAAGHVWNP